MEFLGYFARRRRRGGGEVGGKVRVWKSEKQRAPGYRDRGISRRERGKEWEERRREWNDSRFHPLPLKCLSADFRSIGRERARLAKEKGGQVEYCLAWSDRRVTASIYIYIQWRRGRAREGERKGGEERQPQRGRGEGLFVAAIRRLV